MHKRLYLFALLSLAILSTAFLPKTASACGYDGFYFGFGYEQLFMVTPEHQLVAGGNGDRISFWPSAGANAVFGYDICGTRWGVQFPIEYSRIKLNHEEWINSIGSSMEAVFRVIAWKNGLDFHLVGGVGWSYLTEGRINDNTRSWGFNIGAGPGLTYIFSRTEKLSVGVAAEMPIRYHYYFGSHLSSNGTSAIAFPLRISVQLGF